ncbi:SH3 domain-containing protein [Rhodobacterales bacterium HKCCE4037]|nr:SH3 domain-containing protein [Rhodobacterales bacterium HKCCE4037]
MIIIPGADHGDDIEVTRGAGQNWLVSIISGAEAEARTPPAAITDLAARSYIDELTEGLVTTDDGYALETADGELLQITAIINPVDLLPDEGSTEIAAVSVVDPSVVAPVEQEVADARVFWRVTGSNVNFRAGPSTNTAILAGLVQGDEVEYIGDAADGWAHLRVPDSGLEGYMAARFLEPVN